jgi:hypothetical protein
MAKKKQQKYEYTEVDIFHHNFATRNNFAVVKKPIPDRYGFYWLIKYKPDNYKKWQYYRIDKTKPDDARNREVFTEYEADLKISEILKQFYNLKNEKNGSN